MWLPRLKQQIRDFFELSNKNDSWADPIRGPCFNMLNSVLQTVPSGSMSEHLEYRHFDVLQPVPNSDAEMLGSFIIGIPAMMFREFQNDYPDFELDPAILRSISPEERRKINRPLAAKPGKSFGSSRSPARRWC